MPDDTELVAARLPTELVDLARKVGKGNVSAGIREALEYLRSRHNRKPSQEDVNAAIATLAQMQEEATP